MMMTQLSTIKCHSISCHDTDLRLFEFSWGLIRSVVLIRWAIRRLNNPYTERVVVVSLISERIQHWYISRKHFVNTRNAHNIETLLHSAGGHRGSRKAHPAGNQKIPRDPVGHLEYAVHSTCAYSKLLMTKRKVDKLFIGNTANILSRIDHHLCVVNMSATLPDLKRWYVYIWFHEVLNPQKLALIFISISNLHYF